MPPEFLRPLKSEEKSTPKKATEKSTPKNAAKEKRPREDTPSPKTASDDASAIGVGQKLSVCWRPMPKGDLQVLLHSQTPKGKLQWYDAEVTATDGEGGSVTLYYALDDKTFDGQMLHGDGRIVYKLVEPAEPKTAAPKKVTKARETRPREDTPSPTPVDAPTDFSGPEYAHLSDYGSQRLATMEENARALRAFGIDDDLASMRTAPKELSEEEGSSATSGGSSGWPSCRRTSGRRRRASRRSRSSAARARRSSASASPRSTPSSRRPSAPSPTPTATGRARPRSAAAAGRGRRRRRRRRSPTRSARAWRRRRWIEPMRKWFAPQLSEANLKSVMKVVQKLAAGAGVEHTQHRGKFLEGTAVNMGSDFHQAPRRGERVAPPRGRPRTVASTTPSATALFRRT